MIRIEAEVLVPGRGQPIEHGCVLIDGDKITFAGAAVDAPRTPGVDLHRVPAVMPGLWDCHGHFAGCGVLDVAALATTPAPLAAMRVVNDAGAALEAGFTSVREVGGFGVYLTRAVDEGTVTGPSVFGAGAILSMTGGHGDIHKYPSSWVHDLCGSHGVMSLCDGVPECLKAVREQLRRGARLIKICASGGVLSELDDPVHQQFSTEELHAIVSEAGRAERVVAAHCHGKAGIVAALEAGVRTIEHGTYLDDESADMMRELGAILVPTRLIVNELLRSGRENGLAEYAYQKALAIADRHAEAMALAYEKGVTIALGTDVVTTGADRPAHWGQNAGELPLLVAAGMTPLEAIEAATATGPLTLGPQAPQSGRLAAGYDADVIAITSDPVADLGVLLDPRNVTHVWKAGRLVKHS